MYVINNIIILLMLLLSFLLLSLSFLIFLTYIMSASKIHSEMFKMLEEKPI